MDLIQQNTKFKEFDIFFVFYEIFVVLLKDRNMRASLSAKEEQAMQAVWKAGEGTVKTFLDHLSVQPLPRYTTLASTIKNLEKKGYIKGRLIGNVYLYKPLVAQGQHRKKTIVNLIREHFNNSYREVVTFFAEEEKISPAELRDIIMLIEQKKKA
jgi:BlaI family penicillinase repressor